MEFDEEYEASRGESETHYPFIKELEPAFWKRQEEILRQLEEIEIARVKEKEPYFWTEYPPLLTEDSLFFEDYLDVVIDWREKSKKERESAILNAKVGDLIVEPRNNIRTVVSKEKLKELGLLEEGEEELTGEVQVVVYEGYLIWEVVRPPILEPRPNGQWSTDCWIPEILKEEGGKKLWQKASDEECANWSKIPIERKRVRFCIGVIPFESKTHKTPIAVLKEEEKGEQIWKAER